MIKIKINNEEFKIKNLVDELLIGEFEMICEILNDKVKTKMQKWSDVFIFLGVPVDAVDDFDSDAFISIIQEFNLITVNNDEIVKSFEVDGYNYVCYDEHFKITVKEMGLIETAATKDEVKYLGEMMAIMYKRSDLTKTEHFDKAHLKFKAELFRKNISAEIAIPFITFLSKKLVKDVELIKEENNV